MAYFDNLDESSDSLDNGGSKNESDKNEQELSLAAFTSLPVLEQACFATSDGPPSPLENIVKVSMCAYSVCVS